MWFVARTRVWWLTYAVSHATLIYAIRVSGKAPIRYYARKGAARYAKTKSSKA
jgi:hypothetical protein